jgi:hypothetical protein
MLGSYVIAGLIMLVSWLVSNNLKKPLREVLPHALTERHERTRDRGTHAGDHGITNVKVISVPAS